MTGLTKSHQIKCMVNVFFCTSAPPPVPEGTRRKRSWTEKTCLHCRNPLIQSDRRQCLHNAAQLLAAPPLHLVVNMLASSKYPMSPHGYTVYHMHTPRLGTTVNQALDLIPCPGIHEHTRHTLSYDMLLTLDLTHLALFSDIRMIFS